MASIGKVGYKIVDWPERVRDKRQNIRGEGGTGGLILHSTAPTLTCSTLNVCTKTTIRGISD